MMKKAWLLSGMLTITLLLMVCTNVEDSEAADTLEGACGVNVRYSLQSDTLTISGTGNMGDYYEGDSPWKILKDKIKTVVIESGVKSIGEGAFNDHTSLESAVIGDSVTTVGKYAFSGCSGLKDVTIGKSVESIGEHAFSGCAMESVVIGDSVTSIDQYAFSGCESLKTANVGNTLKTISNSTFYGCTSLESVVIGDSVSSIGSHAFYECGSLKTIHLGKSVATIEYNAFFLCIKLESFTTDDNNKTFKASNGVLYNADCTKLIKYAGTAKEFIIPGDVNSIEAYAFGDNAYLKSLIIKDTVKTIEDNAVYESSLDRISIDLGCNARVSSFGVDIYDIDGTTELTDSDNVNGFVFLKNGEAYIKQATNRLSFIWDEDSTTLQYGVGEKIGIPDSLVKEGYVIECDPALPEKMPARNLDINVSWSVIKCTVIISGEGVTVKNGETIIENGSKVDYGTELTIMIIEKDGYTALVKVGDEIVNKTWKVTGDVAFTGVYFKNSENSESETDNTAAIIIAAVAVVIVAGLAGFFALNRR